MKNKGRARTISKVYFNDEIDCVLPNGDIHLKMNVSRKSYGFKEKDLTSTFTSGAINYHALYLDNFRARLRAVTDIDGVEDSKLDNWETE